MISRTLTDTNLYIIKVTVRLYDFLIQLVTVVNFLGIIIMIQWRNSLEEKIEQSQRIFDAENFFQHKSHSFFFFFQF